MEHAIIKLGEYIIPLIGINKEATVYFCDLCGKDGGIEELELSSAGNQFLCNRCRKES